MDTENIVFAAKCAPKEKLLSAVEDARLRAVELYTNACWLGKLSEVISTCQKFPFRYAIHAPTDTFQPIKLTKLAGGINAEIVVFHDTFWDDELNILMRAFEGLEAKLCVENVATVHEPIKFMRRYGMVRCLDLEHMQMESAGVFEEVFLEIIKTAIHVHMSGYSFGSESWHTHIHHNPEHSRYLLNLLRQAHYTGMVVSEARVCFQTLEEFNDLVAFAKKLLNE